MNKRSGCQNGAVVPADERYPARSVVRLPSRVESFSNRRNQAQLCSVRLEKGQNRKAAASPGDLRDVLKSTIQAVAIMQSFLFSDLGDVCKLAGRSYAVGHPFRRRVVPTAAV